METQERRKRARALYALGKKLFPRVGMALHYGNHFELLVAVMLSAQCTDKRVNQVTKKLFTKYRTIESYARASLPELERDVYETGFYKNKAKNIKSVAQKILVDFNGVLPQTMNEMLTLPGVARKTANVVLGNAFGIVEGIAVDTHVRRFAIRFNLSDYRDPLRIEKDLMALLPKKNWFHFTYVLIEYGREICPARKHDCSGHPFTRLYPQAAACWPRAK